MVEHQRLLAHWGAVVEPNRRPSPLLLRWPLRRDMGLLRLDDQGVVRLAAVGCDFDPVCPPPILRGRALADALLEPLRSCLLEAIGHAHALGCPIPFTYARRRPHGLSIRTGLVIPEPRGRTTILVRNLGLVPDGPGSR